MCTRRPAVDSQKSGGTSESLDDLLSDPHCRYLLVFLRETDGPTAVSTAARHIVSKLTDVPTDQVPANVERRVQTWLHHGQLPTLEARGIVDFDPERRTVTDDAALPPVDEEPLQPKAMDSESGNSD